MATEKDFIELYTQTDLAKREWKTRPTIANWKRYIKVRYTDWQKQAQYRLWNTASPYWYKYISWDDVKKIAEKQFWRKIWFI